MPDFNKGDFTQQGVAGHVNANLRLNEKRLVSIDLTSNEEAAGCNITGTVKDLLNNQVYGVGAGVSGNIEITENGENINVAPYATATVNVAGGGSLPVGKCTVTIVNSAESTTNIDFSDSGTPINLIDGYIAHDNYLAVSNTYFEVEEAPVIAPGESLTLDLYYGHLTGNEGTGVYFNNQPGYAFTTSNVNNLEYSTESEYYAVTDHDNDSSITLTVVHTV
ncbi:MAG: hypothetical protein IIY57_05205 [Erysipelotrichaceae bacterium]|nr:hypothetical protein [Erysipelotrichaceae bacterium]